MSINSIAFFILRTVTLRELAKIVSGEVVIADSA